MVCTQLVPHAPWRTACAVAALPQHSLPWRPVGRPWAGRRTVIFHSLNPRSGMREQTAVVLTMVDPGADSREMTTRRWRGGGTQFDLTGYRPYR